MAQASDVSVGWTKQAKKKEEEEEFRRSAQYVQKHKEPKNTCARRLVLAISETRDSLSQGPAEWD